MTNQLTRIEFVDIVKRYNKSKLILNGVDILLKGNECTLISGENGSGKSSLLRIIAGLLKPDSAFINTGLENVTWKKYRKIIRQQTMYLYQDPYMFDGTVNQNLGYALNKKSTRTIEQALQWARLEHRATTQAKCLSGGEKQRVALAQAWLKQPSILLLDEPTANMDHESRQRTEELLLKFKESGTALLIASHDPLHFQQIIDTRLLLKNGKIIESEELENRNIDLTDNNITLFPQKMQQKNDH